MRLHTNVRRPSPQCLRATLDDSDIINCPFTSIDDKTANDIRVKNIDTIRGRQVRQSQKAMPKLDATHVPSTLKQQYRDVRLFVDVLWTNSLPFPHTISEILTLRTIARLLNREKESLSGFLTAGVDLCKNMVLMSLPSMLTLNSNVSKKLSLHPST